MFQSFCLLLSLYKKRDWSFKIIHNKIGGVRFFFMINFRIQNSNCPNWRNFRSQKGAIVMPPILLWRLLNGMPLFYEDDCYFWLMNVFAQVSYVEFEDTTNFVFLKWSLIMQVMIWRKKENAMYSCTIDWTKWEMIVLNNFIVWNIDKKTINIVFLNWLLNSWTVSSVQ